MSGQVCTAERKAPGADCFNCPFDDCVFEGLDYAEISAQRELDLDARMTPQQKKIAAYQKAYYEANREEIAERRRVRRRLHASSAK